MTLPLMVFAAGFGTRMGALTAHQPKPMIPVAGRPLIDHALGLGLAVGAGPMVVNTHYLADQIAHHLAGRPVVLSHEAEEILETGGGLRQALPHLGQGPVMTLNSDAVWTGLNPLRQLLDQWDPAQMDALLLLLPADQARGYRGTGDFVLDAEGRISRAKGAHGMAYLGAQILRPEGLHRIPQRVFSLNLLWDEMIAKGRAFGMVHQGGWCDVGRPEGIAEAEALLGAKDV